jgi:pilus assembly protein CpaE
MAKGKKVSIYGAKGGIGKSTFVLNLAGVLANMQKKVLIIDLDLSNGSIACSLNVPISKTIYNFCDDYNNNRFEMIDGYITKYNKFIDIIAAPKDPRQASRIDDKYIEILADKCTFKYDIILFDLNNSLNEISVSALDISDNILFMITNDLISLKNSKNILNIMQDNDFNNYKLILNNSVYPNKDYLSLYDIKTILGKNIDYIISKEFYYKKFDALVNDGEVLTLKFNNFKDYKIFSLIAQDILGGKL